MRVKELLKERGMTAKELAARLGMTETGLSIAKVTTEIRR